MGRSIEFRGINIADGLWAYGGIDIQRDTPIIITHGARAFVDHKTVGQFTGLLDKNGNKIFEGDLIKNPSGRVCVVTWCEFEATFDCEPINPVVGDSDYSSNQYWKWSMEVIGNIHEA